MYFYYNCCKRFAWENHIPKAVDKTARPGKKQKKIAIIKTRMLEQQKSQQKGNQNSVKHL